jgi:hypothetical protein
MIYLTNLKRPRHGCVPCARKLELAMSLGRGLGCLCVGKMGERSESGLWLTLDLGPVI